MNLRRYCLIFQSCPTRRHEASIRAIGFSLDTCFGVGGHFVTGTAVSVVVFPFLFLSNNEVLLLSCQFSDLSPMQEFLSIVFAVYNVLYFSQLHFVIYVLHKQFYFWFCHHKIILYIKPNMCWFHFFPSELVLTYFTESHWEPPTREPLTYICVRASINITLWCMYLFLHLRMHL